MRRIRIGIDTGGTFTDVVAFDESTGSLTTTKTPSTPSDPGEGFLNGVDKVLGLLGAGGEEVAAVSHGTTVATNALLEDRIEHMGLITTTGYRFILEIARQSVPDGYGNSYFWVKPDRIVPVDRVKEVGGRLDVRGEEVAPFDEEDAVAVARWFRGRGIETIGVCFLHAYANDVHERRMLEVLQREHPDAVVSLSSEVLREYREYERTVTTLVDASVKPRVGRYIRGIAQRLDAYTTGNGDGGATEVSVPFYIMKSNGGVISSNEVVHQPITTVLSGPAAGALGAALVAGEAGYDRILTCDGGGTSTDVSVVLGGEPTLTTEGSIGRFPSKIPMIDIVTVGAGGGSIAWISPEGNLKVGPRSAGADPGPLCYAKGGTEPTVTDAHVFLGRIPPHLLGGEIPLDRDAARAGIERLAGELGLSSEDAARGILEISAWNQANAIRQITVKRGLDVREFAMAAFGGSGPLLVCRLIDILGLQAVVVPLDPGNLSAFGLLTVDVKNDYVQTHVVPDASLDLDQIAAVYGALEERAADALDREGFDPADHRFVRTADLRYDGQAFEVRVPASAGPVDADFQRAVVAAFHDEHERLYGYCYRDEPRHGVEWVNLRVSGVGPIQRPSLRRLEPGDGDTSGARTGTRPVVFGGDAVDTPIYARERLRAGDLVEGPAIVEEFGSTVPIHPGFSARVDELANLVVTSVHADTTAEGAR
ncbi:hydantoinase/oxoprolinase family protein [Egicoccus sp. AB-alg2]|uniref:hydantoinase/oxoprolinase family protein n=1 Tax=Egicoccus sp. AB-alg2 TaxID=3242693 RepID=UPI00359D4607